MRLLYMAKDGRVFDNLEECENHEKKLQEKKKYSVEVRFSGLYHTTVNAVNEEEAKRIAISEYTLEDIDWCETGQYDVTLIG